MTTTTRPHLAPARASGAAEHPQPTRLLIVEPPLQVLQSLAVRLGLNGALFLQQLPFWPLRSPHVYDDCGWIYNSYEDWHTQLPFWSLPTGRRVVRRLETPYLLTCKPLIRATARDNKHVLDQTTWYTINDDVLEALLASPLPEAPAVPQRRRRRPTPLPYRCLPRTWRASTVRRSMGLWTLSPPLRPHLLRVITWTAHSVYL